MNLQSGSDQRTSGIESYVRFRRLWRSISQRRMPRETEKHKQKIFHTKHCWFQMQRRQWRRNERRSWRRHFKKSKGKSTLLALTDIRHIQQCKYIPVNVRKSNLKCGKLSSPDAKAVHELPDKIYQAGMTAENLNGDNHQRSGWRLSPMKSYKNEFNSILQHKYHHWVFRSVLYEFWQSVEHELWFIIARKGRKLR